MFPKKIKLLATIFASAVTLVATAAWARPGITACALVGVAGLHTLDDGSLTDSESEADRRHYMKLVSNARERIVSTFGPAESKPIVVFFNGPDGFGPFKLNRYGSMETFGSRACVMIGPKGQNLDVVSHELMHGELRYRVGSLRSFLQVPTWFDEGVAMQVDYRNRYLLTPQETQSSDYVKALTTTSSFLAANDEALTRNYASSKQVVASWIKRVGAADLYPQLHRIKNGESFSDVFPTQELTVRSSGLPSAAAELKR